MKKILWVVPDFPFPPNHGGRFDIYRRIINVQNKGYWIHLLTTVKSLPAVGDLIEAQKYVQKLDFVVRAHGLSAVLRGLPHQVASRSGLRKSNLVDHYDLVILESELVGELLRNPSLSFSKIVLRIHNDERTYYKNLSKSVRIGLKWAYFIHEMIAFGGYSKKIKRKVKHNWHISKDEARQELDQYDGVEHVPTPFNLQVSAKESRIS